MTSLLMLDQEVFSVECLLAPLDGAVVWSYLQMPPSMVVQVAGCGERFLAALIPTDKGGFSCVSSKMLLHVTFILKLSWTSAAPCGRVSPSASEHLSGARLVVCVRAWVRG